MSTSAVVQPSADGKITLSNIGNAPVTITVLAEGWFGAPYDALVTTSVSETPVSVGDTATPEQLVTMGADPTELEGMGLGTVPPPSSAPASGALVYGPDVDTDDELTADDTGDLSLQAGPEGPLIHSASELDAVTVPENHHPDPGPGSFTVIASWIGSDGRKIYYRVGYWTGTNGFGDTKIREYHNLNKTVVHRTTTDPNPGYPVLKAGTSWYWEATYAQWSCIRGTTICHVIHKDTVKAMVDFRALGDNTTFGLYNAHCTANPDVAKCPDWVKQLKK